MQDTDGGLAPMARRVVILAIALLFFAVPHTLEDFATGEPVEAGVPAPVLSAVVSLVLAAEALGLYWLGQKQRRGLFALAAVGLFWPVASGVAQLPTILGGGTYRSGFISLLYVVGIIVIGLMLLGFSLAALRMNGKAR
jgi:hypothetical protein